MRDSAHREGVLRYAGAIARLLDTLDASSVLEAGVGEATTLANVIPRLARPLQRAAGFDISWSRIGHGRRYAASQGQDSSLSLVVGDLFAIPAADGAFDVVYTSHSIEPNRGREKQALSELYRAARRYVVLLETASRLGNEATKARILEHRYCADLDQHARELGFTIAEHRLFDASTRENNQTELIVIEKAGKDDLQKSEHGWQACPQCRTNLSSHKGHFYCEECANIYPVIDGIPCLVATCSTLATQFLEL